ncbi:MAG: hypothetical protein AAFR17_08345 [Pseudomonadota bacterium]
MPEWDPYYLARGIERALPKDETAKGKARLAREAAERRAMEEKRMDERDALHDGVALIAAQQAFNYSRRLDRLRAQNTEALMRNGEALDLARRDLSDLLDRAYVHDDGRKLFRSADGTQVFDEAGNDATADVDPDLIAPHHPTFDEFQGKKLSVQKLEEEQEQLFEAQRRLDKAEEDLSDGTLDADELDALEAEFGAGLDDLGASPPDLTKSSARAFSPAAKAAASAPSPPAPAP